MSRITVSTLVLTIAIGLVTVVRSTEPDVRLDELATAEIARGAKTFARACAACHGRRGEGDGPAAADLDPPPRDLTSKRYRFRSTPNGSLPRPEDIERVIRRGLPGTAMPGFGNLFSEQEAADLIAFLYSLHGSPELPEPLPLSPLPEVVDVADGEALYLLVGCWRCHGVDGSGKGPSARTLTDAEGRPMRSTDFRLDPFKGGRRPLDVVRALRTGLNGTPMPSYDAAVWVAREDVGDLPSLEGRIGQGARANIQRFLDASPSREELRAMTEAQRAELRDERLTALAHYVLSFDRRRGSWFWTFQQRPELEGRQP